MRRKFIVLFLLTNALLCHFLEGKTYFVATNGSDSNTGTILKPLLTIGTAVGKAVAGDTIYIRGGTYNLTSQIGISKSGTVSMVYKLWAYTGERPLLNFSSQAIGTRGMSLSGSYWHIKGISIKGAGDNGLYISGANNIIEFCEFYENRDSGLQLAGGANNNRILNCDSYYNADPTDYGDADGFAVKMDVGTGNYFFGCRAWLNVDDGWDGYLRGADNVSTTIENCWTWKNGYFKDGTDAGANANGNGFKMGGSDDKTLMHNMVLKNCLAFENKSKGFDQNNNKGSMTLYNCTGYNNTGNNFSVPTTLNAGKTCIITNCANLGANKINLGTFVIQTTNSWQSPFNVTSDDFLSINSAEVTSPRQADGSLPLISYMHLAGGSDLIDGGTDIGLPFNGTKPDLGAWETGNHYIYASITGSGYVILNPAGGVYAPGTQVSISAYPLPGNMFVEWSGDITGTQPTQTLTINSNISVNANFQISNAIPLVKSDNTLIKCNPSFVKESTTVNFYLTQAEIMNISLISLSGAKVSDLGNRKFTAGFNSEFILLPDIKPGLYMIVLSSKISKLQCRIIKE